MGEKKIMLDEKRAYSTIYGRVDAPFHRARYQQDGCYFNPEKELIEGQNWVGAHAPALEQTPLAALKVDAIGRIEIDAKQVKGLNELDAWMSGASYQDLLKYGKETLNVAFYKTKMPELKELIRLLFVAKATSGHNKTPDESVVGKVD